MIEVELLRRNPNNSMLHNSNDTSFVELVEDVRRFGVREPITIDRNLLIVSGHRRFKAAVQLGLDSIPSVVSNNTDALDGGVCRARSAYYSVTIKVYTTLHELRGLSQGSRTDLKGQLPLESLVADKFGISKSTLKRLKTLNNELVERFGSFEASKEWWVRVDAGQLSPEGAILELRSNRTQVSVRVAKPKGKRKPSTAKRVNAVRGKSSKKTSVKPTPVVRPLSVVHPIIPAEDVVRKLLSNYVKRGKVNYEDQQNVETDEFKIYQNSSANMHHLADESVQCIVTSPPYFRMRVYGNGKDEIGREKQMVEFINSLMTIFRECKRVLKPDGTLWVNINDCFDNGAYNATDSYLITAMLNDSFILHDKLTWSKPNPTPVISDRSQRNHEYFLVFKKSRDVYYTREWMENCDEEISSIVYGLNGQAVNRKVKSSFTLNGSMFTTNVANTGGLRDLCEEMGMDYMHHTATFPWILPYIAIQCSTKVGDLVVDCFSGTATTGLVAVHTGRKYVGYELNTTFIEASIIQMNSCSLEPLAA